MAPPWSEQHEPPADVPWDEAAARTAADRIVEDARASFDPVRLWPCHPRDLDEGDDHRTHGYTSLYLGATGVAWALQRLAGSSPIGPDELVRSLEEEPDVPGMRHGLLLGRLGVALVAHAFDPFPDRADGLEAAARATIPRVERELLWGAPGAIHAALAAHALAPDARWLAVVRVAVDELWRTLEPPDGRGLRLWTQDLSGRRRRFLGLGHGFAGNAHALLRSGELLGAERRASLIQIAVAVLEATAVRAAGLVNWPAEPDQQGPATRVQICHGAPGIVVAFAGVAPEESEKLDALLLAAGETTWAAGPIARGPGLCHGTAGNGYALLALFERTGDPLWLDRARRDPRPDPTRDAGEVRRQLLDEPKREDLLEASLTNSQAEVEG